MEEIDIWRTATLLIRQHGGDAAFFAAQRADALLTGGDPTGGLVWLKVFRAIEELKRQAPREGETLN